MDYQRFRTARLAGQDRTELVRRWGLSAATADDYEHMLDEELEAGARLFEFKAKDIPDFGEFRALYLGRTSTPWQVKAAHDILEWVYSPEKEYVVLNAPPESGKSTLFVHDIPVWLVTKDRTLRTMVGSRTHRQAAWYTGRIRNTLSRNEKLLADFGEFKPADPELWRRDDFLVEGALATDEKESSFAAYGQDSGFLGGRFNLVIWDDLVDTTNTRHAEVREALQEWFDAEATTRVNEAGAFVLQGQRIGPDDLYRYCLNQTMGDDEGSPRYSHVVYRAHYEDRCEELHDKTDPPWPVGCLLEPERVSWRNLRAIAANRMNRYRVSYQQEDVDPEGALVRMEWIEGCKDHDRRPGQLPKVDLSECISVAGVDPSARNYWGILWFLYHPDSEHRFLIDAFRDPMEAPELLDWNPLSREYYGLMHQWQLRSIEMGCPIRYWVIEVNAQQRFLAQQTLAQYWARKYQTNLVPHQTTLRKYDEQLGIEMIAPHYQYARVRIPWQMPSPAIKQLVHELTTYPEAKTDDLVMANWFVESYLPKVARPRMIVPKQWRPSWISTARV